MEHDIRIKRRCTLYIQTLHRYLHASKSKHISNSITTSNGCVYAENFELSYFYDFAKGTGLDHSAFYKIDPCVSLLYSSTETYLSHVF